PHVRAHHHPGAAAERGVVHGAVGVSGPVPQVVHIHGEQPRGPGLADQAELERGEVAGEDGDDVDAPGHSCSPSSSGALASSPAGGSRTTRPPGTSTTGTIAVTNGTRVRCPSGSRSTRASWAGRC